MIGHDSNFSITSSERGVASSPLDQRVFRRLKRQQTDGRWLAESTATVMGIKDHAAHQRQRLRSDHAPPLEVNQLTHLAAALCRTQNAIRSHNYSNCAAWTCWAACSGCSSSSWPSPGVGDHQACRSFPTRRHRIADYQIQRRVDDGTGQAVDAL
jgi:hypothetical protein